MITIEESEIQPGSLIHKILRQNKPTHRLWAVEDREHGDPSWTEIAALWPTKGGTGFTGRIEKSSVFPSGVRLVILPARSRAKGQG